MDGYRWKDYIQSYSDVWEAIIPGDKEATIAFCADQFIHLAETAIAAHGFFSVALSGGSTPKAIFQKILSSGHKDKVDWNRVMLFWSDERAVPADHPDSNYKMAMDAGFSSLPLASDHIFRMKGEGDIEKNALEYEKLIETNVPGGVFDLVMLGMGDDGHTASLFPKTHALHTGARLVVANYVPKFNSWRMTLTFECINRARKTVIYVLGESKAKMLETVLEAPRDTDTYPVQGVGTPSNKALLIADNAALSEVYLH